MFRNHQTSRAVSSEAQDVSLGGEGRRESTCLYIPLKHLKNFSNELHLLQRVLIITGLCLFLGMLSWHSVLVTFCLHFKGYGNENMKLRCRKHKLSNSVSLHGGGDGTI